MKTISKKISILVLVLVVALGCVFGFASIASSSSSIKVGDVNADGSINTKDAKLALLCVQFPDLYEPLATGMSLDFNSDGATTVDDVAYLLMRLEHGSSYYPLPDQSGFQSETKEAVTLPTIKM